MCVDRSYIIFLIIGASEVLCKEIRGTVYYFNAQEENSTDKASNSNDCQHQSPDSSIYEGESDEDETVPSYISGILDLLKEDEYEKWDSWSGNAFDNFLHIGKKMESNI